PCPRRQAASPSRAASRRRRSWPSATASASRCSTSTAARSSEPSTRRSRVMAEAVHSDDGARPAVGLYGYLRCSAAFRARIALNLKGIVPETRYVHLLKDGGQQHAPDYRALNPQALIPAL